MVETRPGLALERIRLRQTTENKKAETMAKRVLIVGAGPGGLAIALLLAKEGLDVTIVEKQPRVGGRTSCIEADGYRFDVGPTFFLYPQILDEIFAPLADDQEWTPLPGI